MINLNGWGKGYWLKHHSSQELRNIKGKGSEAGGSMASQGSACSQSACSESACSESACSDNLLAVETRRRPHASASGSDLLALGESALSYPGTPYPESETGSICTPREDGSQASIMSPRSESRAESVLSSGLERTPSEAEVKRD